MPVSLEERQRRSKAMKEYQANITPEERQEMVAKAQETRQNHNVVKNAIEKMFNKQYLMFDSSCGEDGKTRGSHKVTGVEAMYMELMRVLLDKETSPTDKLKIVESMAKYAGYEPSQKKEQTTNVNVGSWEDIVAKMTGVNNAIEVECE
jgi:hypothetical protein